MMASTLGHMLQTARLRITLVALLSLVFWGSLFGIFYEAFHFLEDLHADVIPMLFNAFFLSLMVMLIFSSGILLYSGLFTSREARLLLTLPATPDAIFAHVFRESIWFSSWGFVLLGSPMLVAYGLVHGASLAYYLLMLPLMVSFAIIPATLGGMLCLTLVRFLPRLRLHVLSVAGVLAVALGGWLGWSAFSQNDADRLTTSWFEQAFSRLAVTEQRFLPSWWLTSGLMEASRSSSDPQQQWAALAEAGAFLAVLVANGLFLQLLAGLLARAWYRRGYGLLAGEYTARRAPQASWVDHAIERLGSKQGLPLRLLLVKDLRLFRRDIAQWSQFAIFFGLLAIYFVNLRSFHYDSSYASLIGSLNLGVVGLILSTFTTRFVYPMISLEGRRFWILGLLPLRRDQSVWSKFLFSVAGSLPPCCLLILLSDRMLGLPGKAILLHEIACVTLCIGLSGIAVGLGALIPDLREASPSKIAAGFGGTLSLVLSSLFIMPVVLAAGLPFHAEAAITALGSSWPWLAAILGLFTAGSGVAVSVGVLCVLGLFAGGTPLMLGIRSFRRLEA
jgi:ABC-2 type transport system permease protein